MRVSRPGGGRSGKSRSWCLPCPSQPCQVAALSTWTTTCRCWGLEGAGWERGAGGLASLSHPPQVSLKVPEATVTLPVFIGNIAVNHAPLSPRPGPGLPPGASIPVVPSAPPQEEAEAAASSPHFADAVSLSTKSHSQQQSLPATFGSVPAAPEPRPQDGSPAPHPLPPPLCISTGATVPYFAEGSGGPVPTTSTLILPPEYSSWGYPYGE